MHHRRMLATVVAAALFLAACNGDDGAENPVTEDLTGQSTEDEPPEENLDEDEDPTDAEDQEEPEDPEDGSDGSDGEDEDPQVVDASEDFSVPDEIDEEYVQRVMDELMRRDSDLVRGLLEEDRAGSLQDEEQAQIDSLFGGPIYTTVLRTYSSYTVSEEARSPHLPADDFGERPFDVKHLHSASSNCITALGWWDVTATANDPYDEDFHLAFVLRRDDSLDPSLNPTQWRVWDNTDLRRGDENVPQDEWDDIEFGQNLDTGCEQSL